MKRSHATRVSAFMFLAACLTFLVPAHAQWMPRNPVTAVQKLADSVVFTQKSGFLRVQVCTDSIIHVLYSPTSSFQQHPNYVVIKTAWTTPSWTMEETTDDFTIATARL